MAAAIFGPKTCSAVAAAAPMIDAAAVTGAAPETRAARPPSSALVPICSAACSVVSVVAGCAASAAALEPLLAGAVSAVDVDCGVVSVPMVVSLCEGGSSVIASCPTIK